MSNNENSVIEYLKTNNEVLFDKIVNALRKGKQVNFTDINQSDIIILSPQKAFEYAGEEGDKYFKVWMVGSTIAWCTWANSMVDSDFRWNAKARNENKRDNKVSIRPRACFFPLFSFLPLWLHYNLNPLCVQY